MSGTIHLRREGEHIAVLEIDNPPRNTLGSAMRARFRDALAELSADLSVRAVIITGRGKAFCSGDDLREEFAAASAGDGRGANLLDFGRLLDEVEAFRAVTIAAIGGWCVGGGMELALCCDIRLASDHAQFVCAGVNVGLMASAYRLPRLIGIAAAKHMLLTGSVFDGHAALRMGLAAEMHDPDQLMPAALRLAERIASRAPLSVEASKRFAARALDLDPQHAMAEQAEELAKLIVSHDHVEAVTAFLEKRDPSFTRS
jgi:enoyl-CoA hydratase